MHQKESGSESLRIVPVDGRRALEQFIRFPSSVYEADPCWIPPLLLERRQHLSKKNPFFSHADGRLWLAYRGSRPVGRISAQVDTLYLERYEDQTGFFGMVEAEEDAEVFQALFTTAEAWLRREGMVRACGPFNLSINQECGLLIDGFDTPPMIMMGHARSYYPPLIERSGYKKAKDLLAYRVGINFHFPPVIERNMRKASDVIRIRPLRRSRFKEDLRILQDIFEDAWSDNWGFIPYTNEEFRHLGEQLKLLLDDDFVQIAEVDGVPAAMIVALPNVNEVIADLKGRLLPFGWLQLLWRLKVTFPKTARVPLMGVRKRFHRTPLGAALAFGVIDAVRGPGIRRGVQEVELSWILEDNAGMRNILESIGCIPYKRYRIYEKSLG